MSVLQINLLGVPEVCRDGERRRVPMGKTLALLAYLAVEGGLQPREALVALLWPRASEQVGRANLRTTLTMLRKTLGEQPGTPVVLRAEAHAVGLTPDAVLVDVQTLATAAALVRKRERVPALRSQLEGAVTAWRGLLLNTMSMSDAPDFETWLLGRREDAQRWLGEVLTQLASLYEAGGDLAAAVSTLEHWVCLDPLNEPAQRRLLAAHLASGNITAGLHAYEACRAVLAAELGSEPSLEIQAVAEQLQVAVHHPAVPAPRPPGGTCSEIEPPLVGRAAELVALRGCFAQAQQGQTQVVVLAGETGIGKTRLAGDFLAWAQAQGAEGLRGQAFALGANVPYVSLAEALRPRLERENAPDDLLDDLWLGALARVLPELGERYPHLAATETACTEAHLLEATVQLIAALTARQPLVLFLDDVQWVDCATRALVLYAARRWAQQRVRLLVLLAVRSDDVGTNPELATWLEQVDRAAPATRLELRPLTPSATARLVAGLAGASLPDAPRHSGNSVEARFAAWLAAETGGHPFFIIETLRVLLEKGVLALHPDAEGSRALDVRVTLRAPERLQHVVPARVQEAIRTRLNRLSRTAMALLVAGAAMGPYFTFKQLRYIAQMSEREAFAGLEEAVRARLLHEDTMCRYSFCYATLRAVVWIQAGAARRQVYWRRAQTLAKARSGMAPVHDRGAAMGSRGTGACDPVGTSSRLALERQSSNQLQEMVTGFDQKGNSSSGSPVRRPRAMESAAPISRFPSVHPGP
jgi:DNA-binding SARP family transcriptional activator